MSNWNSRYPGYILTAALFTLINSLLLYYLGPTPILNNLSPFMLIVYGLAAYRLADVISTETVTEPLRAPFVKVRYEKGERIEEPLEGWRGSVGALLRCPSCSGVWIASFIVYGYLYLPAITTILTWIFAISGLERLFRRTIQLLEKNG